MEFIHEFGSGITAVRALSAGWLAVDCGNCVATLRCAATRHGPGVTTIPLLDGQTAAMRCVARGGAEDRVTSGVFILSRTGAVSFRATTDESSEALKLATPRGVFGLAANDTHLVCWHSEGINAYSIAQDALTSADDAKLLGSVTIPDIEDSLVRVVLGPSRTGTSHLYVLTRTTAGVCVTTYCATSSSFTKAHRVDIPLLNAKVAIVAFSVDPTRHTTVLVAFDDGSLVVARDGKITHQARVAVAFADVVLTSPSTAVGASVLSDRQVSLQQLDFAKASSAKEGRLLAPELLATCDTTAAASNVTLCSTADGVLLATGTALYACPLRQQQQRPAKVTVEVTTARPNTLAAAMLSTRAAGLSSSASAVQQAEQVVEWLLGGGRGEALPFVVRDETMWLEAEKATHAVLKGLDGRLSRSNATALAERIAKYLSVAEGVTLETAFAALRVVALTVGEAALKPKQPARAAGPSHRLQSDEAALVRLCPLLAAVARGVSKKVLGGFSASAAAAQLPSALSGAVLEALYCVVLQSLRVGALAVAHAAVQLVDGIVIANAATLCAEYPFVIMRVVPIVQHVGRWSLTDAGLRLGQITAHCGPTADNAKEPAAVPHVPYRIATSAPVHIRQEVVHLGQSHKPRRHD